MGTSRLNLYNGALVNVLGERALGSLTENRAPRRYLDQAWNNSAVDKLLIAGQWKFARRSVRMDADAGLAPQFGWQYAFARPQDHIRTLEVCADEMFCVPLEAYQEEDQVFVAVVTPFYLAYVSNDPAYGANLGKWPANFVEYAEFWLASKIIASLTGNKTDKAQLDKDVHKALAKAQSTDAMEGPTKYPPPGSWINARMRGRMGSWDRGSRTQLIG